ncbi:TetR/AcrR family transcriptional regulator [Persicimonas caeni]|jgi:AcrR family transcriptional regulator|uniref:TetR/AcrR family transcriptional regulator n=1 Tax=Persicimonas caeni TaxID=2292766 RepID=A0A4Y6PT86_PERCE|nr:TetR/AcrR family transcriptional regulator [Persicimonas caeni]QDG51460.1 TetR/AcrR family transcriptional regulator [Persicimonas caeni]QED32681.1 TetR/AcrR family transcriptional regulator [Persicimonas caeni]
MEDALAPDSLEILPKLKEAEVPEVPARIMTVALRLFAHKGYAATSVREIVQEADVTNPMLYYYFKSKSGLFAELISHLFGSMFEEIKGVLAETDTFVDKLRGVAWAHLDGCRQSPIALKFVYSVLFGPQTSRPEFDIFTQHVCVIGTIVNVFEDAIAAGEFEPNGDFSPLFLTHQFFGLLNGHLMRTLKLVEVISPAAKRREYMDELLCREEGTRLVEFFLNGAGRIVDEEK